MRIGARTIVCHTALSTSPIRRGAHTMLSTSPNGNQKKVELSSLGKKLSLT